MDGGLCGEERRWRRVEEMRVDAAVLVVCVCVVECGGAWTVVWSLFFLILGCWSMCHPVFWFLCLLSLHAAYPCSLPCEF